MRAARAQRPPPQAMPRTNLQRKRGYPRPEGCPHLLNPAARPPVRGPVGGGGGACPGTDAGRELRRLQNWPQCRWEARPGSPWVSWLSPAARRSDPAVYPGSGQGGWREEVRQEGQGRRD